MSSRILGVVLASLVVFGGIGMVGGISAGASLPLATPATTASPVSVSPGPVAFDAVSPETGATEPESVDPYATDPPTTPGVNASLGAEISGFLLASAAEIDGHVESGMWVTAFERASDLSQKQRVLDRRTGVLDHRFHRIKTRSKQLFGDEENHTLVREARRGELAGQLSGLRAATAEAKTTATSAGVTADDIKHLHAEANNLTLPPTVVVLQARRGGRSTALRPT